MKRDLELIRKLTLAVEKVPTGIVKDKAGGVTLDVMKQVLISPRRLG